MVLNPSNSSNLAQLALKGLSRLPGDDLSKHLSVPKMRSSNEPNRFLKAAYEAHREPIDKVPLLCRGWLHVK